MRYLLISVLWLCAACGKNVFSTYEKKEAPEDATVAMENHNPEKAIAILQDALEKDPDNYQLMGLLAAATAQKYGIDTISIALELADTSSESSETSSTTTSTTSSSNGITKLFKVLPAATTENLDGVKSAVDIFLAIPADSRTRADNFYLTLINTALLGLQTKKFDADGDGQVSPVELLDLSEEDAVAILESLINAQDALASGMTGDASSQATSGSLSSIKDKIDSQPGSTDAEKLRNYLGGGGSQNP